MTKGGFFSYFFKGFIVTIEKVPAGCFFRGGAMLVWRSNGYNLFAFGRKMRLDGLFLSWNGKLNGLEGAGVAYDPDR
jgi:hypothetical protein